MAKNTSIDKSKTSSVVTDVMKKFNASWSYAKQNHHARWDRNYKLYNNKRVRKSFKGTTNTFVAMPFSIIETATSALTAGRPSIDFTAQDMWKYIETYATEQSKPNIKALNSYLDWNWDQDNWDLLTIKSVRTGFLYGIAGEWGSWDGKIARFIPVSTRDLIIDPTLEDPMQLITNPNDFYTGRRYFTTISALKSEMVVDPKTGSMVRRFKNLDSARTADSLKTDSAKGNKEMLIGSINADSDSVEVIEIVTGETIRSVLNRTVEIEDRANPLGIHLLALGRFIADESLIYGKALLDPIAEQVEYLIDLRNQQMDSIADLLSPQWTLDPMYSDKVSQVDNTHGKVYPWGHEALKPLTKDHVDMSSFNEIETIKNEIREAVGVDQIVQGMQADGATTATEINAQMSQAGQRFSLFVRMLERELLYQRVKITYKMMRHYLEGVQLVPTKTADGPKFLKFDPKQFDDSYEPRIELESTVKSKKRVDQQNAISAYQMLIQDPSNDLYQLKKIMYPKMIEGLSEEDLDKIIGAQPPAQGMADPMAGAVDDPNAMGAEMPMDGETPMTEMPSEMPDSLEAPEGAL